MRKFTTVSMLLGIAVIMGYLEALIPFTPGIPGIKIGFANFVIVCSLYLYSFRESIVISILRVIIIGILFTNFSMMLYGLAGCIVSLCVMFAAKKINTFSVIGVSAIGGIMHNITQLCVAFFLLQSKSVWVYTPYLLISGCIAGLLIGYVCNLLLPRLKRLVES